jgi:hypothetical protein
LFELAVALYAALQKRKHTKIITQTTHIHGKIDTSPWMAGKIWKIF